MFECLDLLGPTDHLIVSCDYAPEALQHQVTSWCSHEFRWRTLVSGPPLWQAEITCMPDVDVGRR